MIIWTDLVGGKTHYASAQRVFSYICPDWPILGQNVSGFSCFHFQVQCLIFRVGGSKRRGKKEESKTSLAVLSPKENFPCA